MSDEKIPAAPTLDAPNAPAVPAAPADDLSAIIERWFVERIHNSPVSRDTETFNAVRAAVDDLKQRLK